MEPDPLTPNISCSEPYALGRVSHSGFVPPGPPHHAQPVSSKSDLDSLHLLLPCRVLLACCSGTPASTGRASGSPGTCPPPPQPNPRTTSLGALDPPSSPPQGWASPSWGTLLLSPEGCKGSALTCFSSTPSLSFSLVPIFFSSSSTAFFQPQISHL